MMAQWSIGNRESSKIDQFWKSDHSWEDRSIQRKLIDSLKIDRLGENLVKIDQLRKNDHLSNDRPIQRKSIDSSKIYRFVANRVPRWIIATNIRGDSTGKGLGIFLWFLWTSDTDLIVLKEEEKRKLKKKTQSKCNIWERKLCNMNI